MLFGADDNTVRVTEITKLAMEKRGEGETVPVEVFEGRNLVFVDEGHKGSGGEAWREVRDALGETGFTFEYSATFGQALTAAKDDELTAEYGKAIAFDYSYRYFYDDGYGKDFRILNLQQETTGDRTDTLLLANLLSFYEQQLVFANQIDDLRPYRIEQPLWVFVGSSVNAVRTEGGQARSDVLTVARFLHRTLSDPTWAMEKIGQLLAGESGLTDEGRDLFADKYPYLRNGGKASAEAVYQDILHRTLHTPSSGGLHIAEIRGSEGELGLKAAGSDEYFGLIYIGDTPKFKKLAGSQAPEITVEEDALSGPLFDQIGQPGTTIEALIGSRKFIEGWSSWRVSNMGLLNIGRNEGSQIIQLFGREVRLRGRDMTLKRSAALDGSHPEQIGLLETLNIFAVRANYMTQFRDYLKREGVPAEGLEELPLFIRPNRDFLDKGLVIPRVAEGQDFKADSEVVLEHVGGVRPVAMDVSTRVQSLDSQESGIADASASSAAETDIIPPESLDLVDWDRVYLSLIEHRERKGMDNLVVRPAALKGIMKTEPRVYTLVADASLMRPTGVEEWERLQETVTAILRQYADRLYQRSRERWESAHMVYKTLDETHGNFTFNVGEDGRGRYVVKVPRSERELIDEIQKLIDDCRALYESERSRLPRIHFDRHLYQPLPVDGNDKLKLSPPGLTESEQKFVNDLRAYWADNRGDRPNDVEVFLLRNQGKGAGVGFFEESGFYPDFILWIKDGDSQRVVFVEPHGMIYAKSYAHDEKAQLHERLPELARATSKRSGASNVSLDSYIVSATPYEDLRERYGNGNWDRERFAGKHILFPERSREYDYVAEMLTGRGALIGEPCARTGA